MVSFAVPSIFKIHWDLNLRVKPVRTKPQGDQMEKVLLVPCGGRKPPASSS